MPGLISVKSRARYPEAACHRGKPPPTSSTAARTARSADHANASAVHRHVQRCPCAVSPPTMPQAGLLATPSRNRAAGSSNCCRRDRRSAEGASDGASPTSPPSPTIRCRRGRSMNLAPAPPVLLLLRLLQRRGAERPIRQARQRGVLVAPARSPTRAEPVQSTAGYRAAPYHYHNHPRSTRKRRDGSFGRQWLSRASTKSKL